MERGKSQELEKSLYHDHLLSFKGLLPYAFAGGMGGGLAATLQYGIRTTINPFLEGLVRFTSGVGDSFGDASYLFREYFKFKRTRPMSYFNAAGDFLKRNRDNQVLYYSVGRVIGGIVSMLPDVILRAIGVDVHSPIGSIAAISYAQSDQVGGYFGNMGYFIRERGVKRGFVESFKNPVSLASLILVGMSLTGDTVARTQLTPDKPMHFFTESWIPSLTCWIPSLIGRRNEHKQNSK